jgi:hypothetical protein
MNADPWWPPSRHSQDETSYQIESVVESGSDEMTEQPSQVRQCSECQKRPPFPLLDVTISSRRLYILIFGLIDFVSRLNGGEGAPRLKLSEIAKI